MKRRYWPALAVLTLVLLLDGPRQAAGQQGQNLTHPDLDAALLNDGDYPGYTSSPSLNSRLEVRRPDGGLRRGAARRSGVISDRFQIVSSAVLHASEAEAEQALARSKEIPPSGSTIAGAERLGQDARGVKSDEYDKGWTAGLSWRVGLLALGLTVYTEDSDAAGIPDELTLGLGNAMVSKIGHENGGAAAFDWEQESPSLLRPWQAALGQTDIGSAWVLVESIRSVGTGADPHYGAAHLGASHSFLNGGRSLYSQVHVYSTADGASRDAARLDAREASPDRTMLSGRFSAGVSWTYLAFQRGNIVADVGMTRPPGILDRTQVDQIAGELEELARKMEQKLLALGA